MSQSVPKDVPKIRVQLTKGCYLLLTEAEYKRGIARGKAERRWLERMKRRAAPPWPLNEAVEAGDCASD